MVIKQSSVESKTQFAASSVSERCISAKFNITEAQGVDDRTSTLALKAKSSGIKYTAKKQNSGNIISLQAQTR